MTILEVDQQVRRFLRKTATHSLNSLLEDKDEFIEKYMARYHEKVNEMKQSTQTSRKIEAQKEIDR